MKKFITVIYVIGVLLVLVLSAAVITQSRLVLFPNTMLPMELRELATVWLTLGLVPMLVFSILFYRGLPRNTHKIRNAILIFFPAAICLGCAVFWISVWMVGIIRMAVRA